MRTHSTMIIILLSGLCGTVGAQERKGVMPHFGTLQYAGSIGFVSVGLGYTILNEKARVSGHVGYVPANMGGELSVVSGKLFFTPVTYTVWHRVRLRPFDVGAMVSYHYGQDFESRWPEGQYPRNYYWWSPSVRVHLAMESGLTYEFPKDHRFTSITGYLELNTNELYFVSFIQNIKSVSFWDVLKIGTGVRLSF